MAFLTPMLTATPAVASRPLARRLLGRRRPLRRVRPRRSGTRLGGERPAAAVCASVDSAGPVPAPPLADGGDGGAVPRVGAKGLRLDDGGATPDAHVRAYGVGTVPTVLVDAAGEPLLHIVLASPQIPGNTVRVGAGGGGGSMGPCPCWRRLVLRQRCSATTGVSSQYVGSRVLSFIP